MTKPCLCPGALELREDTAQYVCLGILQVAGLQKSTVSRLAFLEVSRWIKLLNLPHHLGKFRSAHATSAKVP